MKWIRQLFCRHKWTDSQRQYMRNKGLTEVRCAKCHKRIVVE